MHCKHGGRRSPGVMVEFGPVLLPVSCLSSCYSTNLATCLLKADRADCPLTLGWQIGVTGFSFQIPLFLLHNVMILHLCSNLIIISFSLSAYGSPSKSDICRLTWHFIKMTVTSWKPPLRISITRKCDKMTIESLNKYARLFPARGLF